MSDSSANAIADSHAIEEANRPSESPNKLVGAKPWYKRTAIWALILSAIALVLSQLPPVASWLPSPSLKAEVGKRVRLLHDMGIPQYELYVDLENTGNRSLTLTNLALHIRYPGGKSRVIEAESYSPDTSGPSFPLTTVRLEPNRRWSGIVYFYPEVTPNDEEEMNMIKLEIANSRLSTYRSSTPARIIPETIEADKQAVAKAVAFFNRMFDLEKGTYTFSLVANQNGVSTKLQDFEISLYDYHIKTLKAQTEDFRFGWGIDRPIDSNKDVWVNMK